MGGGGRGDEPVVWLQLGHASIGIYILSVPSAVDQNAGHTNSDTFSEGEDALVLLAIVEFIVVVV